MRRVTIAITTALSLLLAVPSFAVNWNWKPDANDTQGPLDIKRAGLKVPGGNVDGDGQPVVCRVELFASNVSVSDVDDFGCYFDTRGTESTIEIWANAQQSGDGLTASYDVYRDNNPVQKDVPTEAWLEDGDLFMKIQRRHLRGRAGFLKWHVETTHFPSGADYFQDDSPNTGAGYHRFNYRD